MELSHSVQSKFSAEDSQAELNALRREMKSLKLFISDRDKQNTCRAAAIAN